MCLNIRDKIDNNDDHSGERYAMIVMIDNNNNHCHDCLLTAPSSGCGNAALICE